MKPFKLAVAICLMWVIIGLCVLIVCPGCTAMNTRGYLKYNSEIVPIEKTGSSEIVELSPGYKVPEGYEVLFKSEFKSGLITTHCGKINLLKEVMKVARLYGADAFRLYDIHEPDEILNTCYRAKVLILRKKKDKL